MGSGPERTARLFRRALWVFGFKLCEPHLLPHVLASFFIRHESRLVKVDISCLAYIVLFNSSQTHFRHFWLVLQWTVSLPMVWFLTLLSFHYSLNPRATGELWLEIWECFKVTIALNITSLDGWIPCASKSRMNSCIDCTWCSSSVLPLIAVHRNRLC